MIREANTNDLPFLSEMLQRMTIEVYGDKAAKDEKVYERVMLGHLAEPTELVLIDNLLNGFVVVKDATEAITPNYHRYIILRIYIRPSKRHTRLYKDIYDEVFKRYPKGEIWGITEIDSPHIKILDKRHEVIAKVYKARRD